jgi:hypothetical protein
MNWLRELWQRFLDAPCPHKWRPAKVAGQPARYCNICEEVELLTREMFYAYFGRGFY